MTHNLSYAAVNVQPIDYDFSSSNHADYTDDEPHSWRVCEGIPIPDDTELTIVIDEDNEVELFTDDLHIEVTTEEGCEAFEPNDDEWLALMTKHWPQLDAKEIRHDIENGDSWDPVMNYAYPLPTEPPDDWKTKVVSCTCVVDDQDHYLALTGGGMDLSWEICESYIALGYYPPAHFSELPSMAGRGESERDKAILAACRCSLEAQLERAQRALARFDENFPS